MANPHPGKRLKALIKAMGVTYDRFGELVAENEVPARAKPYARNNVGEWVSGRSGPKPHTWMAIERVTGKPMQWFHSPVPTHRPATRDKEIPVPDTRAAAKKKGA